MAAIESLRTAVEALSRNPILVAAGALYGFIVLPQNALELAGVPVFPLLLQIATFFVTPFVLAGFLGMADESLGEGASLSTLRSAGRRRYVQLLLGNLVRVGIHVGFAIVAAVALAGFLVMTGLVSTVARGGSVVPSSLGAGALLPAVAIVAVLALVFLLVVFFIQFYAAAIVLDEADAIDGFTRSFRFVRDNLASTLGYSLVTVGIWLLSHVPLLAYVAARTMGGGASARPGVGGGLPGIDGAGVAGVGGIPAAPTQFSTPEAVGLAALSLVASTLFFTVRQTYAVAFYRRHTTTVEERVLDELP